MSCGVYSPEFVDVIIEKESAGMNHIVTGYAEGTGITVEPNADRATPSVGMKGDVSINISADNSYMLTLTLQQTSHTNDVLDRLIRQVRQDPLSPFFTLTLRDASGMTEITTRCGVITQEGTLTYSDTIETREWMIFLPNPSGRIGGNGNFTVDAQTAFEALGGTVPDRWAAE